MTDIMSDKQIKHHLTDALLMAYSAGSLPEAFNLTVATHISMCDDCRARLGAFDAMGGAMVERCDSVAMSAGSLEATIKRIRAGAPQAAPAPRRKSSLPQPLQDYIGGDLEAVPLPEPVEWPILDQDPRGDPQRPDRTAGHAPCPLHSE